MRSMLDLIKTLSPLRLSPCGPGLDECTQILQQELPFTVHEFASGEESNGWIVPQAWGVSHATISNCGFPIYDGLAHPLGVISYSQSFEGRITGAELKRHLFYPLGYDDALVYHCDLLYKQHVKDWGFSVTKQLYDSIVDGGYYDVELFTWHEPGTMKVCEYVLKGAWNGVNVALNAHNCHPFLSNDDLSGVAVGVEVMRRLAQVPNRRFTYRLIIAPEHFGTVFYLHRFGKNNINWALFLEALGTSGPLALQESFHGDSWMDHAMKMAMKGTDYTIHGFRRHVGNDETCWEATGLEIPCPSISRAPFPEYHTSKDSPDIIIPEKMEEAVEVVLEALLALDRNYTMKPKFKGLVCLSNPKYDLYQPFWDPSIPDRRTIDDRAKEWNHLMNCLPRYFDGETTLLDIARKHRMPFEDVRNYMQKWVDKGLVEWGLR